VSPSGLNTDCISQIGIIYNKYFRLSFIMIALLQLLIQAVPSMTLNASTVEGAARVLVQSTVAPYTPVYHVYIDIQVCRRFLYIK